MPNEKYVESVMYPHLISLLSLILNITGIEITLERHEILDVKKKRNLFLNESNFDKKNLDKGLVYNRSENT